MSRLRRGLYRSGSKLGDLEAIASGSPKRIAKRYVRKAVYRHAGRGMRALLRALGL